MATDRPVLTEVGRGRETATGGGGGIGRYIVLGMLAVTVLGAFAILHDAHSTNPVMSVPATTSLARPTTAAIARRDTLAFVPSGASLSIKAAIAAATDYPAADLAGRTEVSALAGGGYALILSIPVDEHALLHSGRIFTGAGEGASNLKSGLLQVTSGQVQFVVRVSPKSGDARFAFRLSKSGETLSSTNWNANTVLSQTQVGDEDIP
jgi:hypothetical protein